MTQYRLEVFDRSLDFVGWQPIPKPDIDDDYTSPTESTIMLTRLMNVSCGQFVNITNGQTLFQGVVSQVDSLKSGMTIKVLPLRSIFNVEFFKESPGAYTSAEGWLKSAIQQEFINTSDSIQRLPISVENLTNTSAVPLELSEDGVNNMWDVFLRAFEKEQIVVEIGFDFASKRIIVTISKNSDTPAHIEADLPAVTIGAFNIQTEADVNKVEIYNNENHSQFAVFYAPDYKAPTKKAVKTIDVAEGESFAEKAEEEARAALTVDGFDNCIELTFAPEYRLMPKMSFGQKAIIHRNGKVYEAFLTRISNKGNATTYTFGRNRPELTKKIRMGAKK